ncbi:MAG TPA: ScyD/ScyE family protein, partial [Thermomicrobiales bacterium]|nr:ScyD/ScyE family protein [Thermomicrobiales bacterium]
GYLFGEDTGMAQPFYAVGYPITEAYWAEVRVGGTTKWVLIQCFERRCLTYTPDNSAGWQVEAGNVGQHYYRWLQEHDDTPPFDELADDLLQARGLARSANGVVYIAEAGTGGDNCIEVGEGEDPSEACVGFTGRISLWMDGVHTVIADDLPSILTPIGDISGPQDVFATAEGDIFAIIGLGGPPEMRALFPDDEGLHLGWIVQVHDDGSWTPIADVSAYEGTENPDGGPIDSNPYSLVVVEDGFVVSDAGGNALLWVSADGMMIETLAVFETRMAPAPPFLGLPDGTMIPMEAVPTGVVEGSDGAYYVGELTGFPFQQGAARVWRVEADGTATVYAEGFTNIIDVAFDDDGDLLVLEIVAASLLGAEQDPRGRLIHVDKDTMEHTVLLHDGLVFPAGVAVGAGNTIYMTNFAVMPNAQLIVFESPLP